jgi:gentisate 1,2-dioxygenase
MSVAIKRVSDPLSSSLETGTSAADRARLFEYSQAANPIRANLTPRIPYQLFTAALYADGPTRVVPLDLSRELKCEGPATGPGLCANFIRLLAGEPLTLRENVSSQVFYVIRGEGVAQVGDESFAWSKGDFFTAPGTMPTELTASADAALYYVHDAPLLRYLGVAADRPRFKPALFDHAAAERELELVAGDPAAAKRSRVSVLLGAEEFPLTRTVTHVLWAMYGLTEPKSQQKPHRHQSIALDFIVDCEPGCYSLVGVELDAKGDIRNPTRVDWQRGCVFVTPPGYWHAHFNESDSRARLIPIQDAGLQTYLRTLDIRFT